MAVFSFCHQSGDSFSTIQEAPEYIYSYKAHYGAVFPGGWLLPDIIVCAPMEERGLIMRENFSKGAILLAQALIAGLIIYALIAIVLKVMGKTKTFKNGVWFLQ